MCFDYGEYSAMGGELSNAEFSRFAFKSWKELEKATYGRIKNAAPSETVRRCMFELIEYLSANDRNGVPVSASSESNDGYSISYVRKDSSAEISDIIYAYLSDTELLYRGVEK